MQRTHDCALTLLTVGDDSVEDGTLVVQRLALLAHSLLAGTERTEVFSSLWDIISEETENDTSLFTTFNLNIEKDFAGNSLSVFKIDATKKLVFYGDNQFLKTQSTYSALTTKRETARSRAERIFMVGSVVCCFDMSK